MIRQFTHHLGFRPRCAFTNGRVALAFLMGMGLNGCLPCGLFSRLLVVEGVLVDGESGEIVEGAAIGGSLFAGDDQISFRDPTGLSGSAVITSDADGRFEVTFLSPEFGEVCGLPPFDRTIRDPVFPDPTRIELIVIRDSCETTHVIEVNEDTVVDLSFPDDTLELRNPILVPPCEADGDNAP